MLSNPTRVELVLLDEPPEMVAGPRAFVLYQEQVGRVEVGAPLPDDSIWQHLSGDLMYTAVRHLDGTESGGGGETWDRDKVSAQWSEPAAERPDDLGFVVIGRIPENYTSILAWCHNRPLIQTPIHNTAVFPLDNAGGRSFQIYGDDGSGTPALLITNSDPQWGSERFDAPVDGIDELHTGDADLLFEVVLAMTTCGTGVYADQIKRWLTLLESDFDPGDFTAELTRHGYLVLDEERNRFVGPLGSGRQLLQRFPERSGVLANMLWQERQTAAASVTPDHASAIFRSVTYLDARAALMAGPFALTPDQATHLLDNLGMHSLTQEARGHAAHAAANTTERTIMTPPADVPPVRRRSQRTT